MLEMTGAPSFDDLASTYDRLIDWPKRLAREGPFFHKIFHEHGVQRILDIGCGTGHHAAMFYSWGLEVEGWDISPAMLEECRRLHGENKHLRWSLKSFADLRPRTEPFDAVICIGNTLALTDSMQEVRDSIRVQVQSVRPGGVGVIQVLNLEALEEGVQHWQKIRRIDEDDDPGVLVKGIHRSDGRGYVEILQLKLPDKDVVWQTHSASFLGISVDDLCNAIGKWGGQVQGVYGSYRQDEFVEDESSDLIVVWWRVRCG